MKTNLQDLNYLLSEMNKLLKEFKSELPEDFYKLFKDLVFHSINSVREMEGEKPCK